MPHRPRQTTPFSGEIAQNRLTPGDCSHRGGKIPETAGTNRVARRRHQAQIVMQVVDSVQTRTQNFVGFVEVV